MARRRAKPAHVADQSELEFTRPSTPTKPARIPMDIDRAARLAIARRAQRAGTGDKVQLTLTIFLTQEKAERLSARASASRRTWRRSWPRSSRPPNDAPSCAAHAHHPRVPPA